MNPFAAGILLGLAGSAHCAGMCGPLVLTVSGWVDPHRSRLPPMLAYHAGRILIYLVLSVAAGLAGHALSYGGLGRGVSIGAGVLLLVVAAGSGSRLLPKRTWMFWSLLLTRACVAANRSTRTHRVGGQLLAGAVNGLLPCGLVYAAAIAAAGLGSLPGAVIFMAGFGLGTVPVLLGMSLSATSLSVGVRARLRRLTPVALALTGTLLIARGVLPAHHAAGAQGAGSALIHHTH